MQNIKTESIKMKTYIMKMKSNQVSTIPDMLNIENGIIQTKTEILKVVWFGDLGHLYRICRASYLWRENFMIVSPLRIYIGLEMAKFSPFLTK